MKKHIVFMLGVLIGFIASLIVFLTCVLPVKSKCEEHKNEVVYSVDNLKNDIDNAQLCKNEDVEDNNINKTEPIENYNNSNPLIEESTIQYENRWGITLTEDEIDLLARIVMLEAGGESDWGKDAVVEVIFNRMYDKDFPDSLKEVLSQKGQFATWKNRNCDAAVPTDDVYESIDCVLSGQTDILPFETVYFSRGGESEKKVQIIIDNHVFCNK